MTLSGSVVAKMNRTCSGGSSTIFRSALNPADETMWASSMMNTLYRSRLGAKVARSRSSRASSTPPWLAASISTTSRLPEPPRARSTHEGHSPQGVSIGCSGVFRWQLSVRARMRADVVLPQPRGPENR